MIRAARPRRERKRVAAITTVYFHNSHADVILSRLFQGENLDFKSRMPDLELAGLYVDQSPENDLSREFSKKYGFRLCSSVEEALCLGGKTLAVEGVLIVGEHGNYPQNDRGQDLYPRKRFFDEVTAVFRRSGRSVPVFVDKHLSHSFKEAKEMHDTSRRMGFPMMAGSSVPLTWRNPPADVELGAHLQEAVGISYHTLYGYGFHALEMLQCLAERRAGGETGIRRVMCLEGPAVWEAGKSGLYNANLFQAAYARQPNVHRTDTEKAVPNPTLFHIEYLDGFHGNILTLNPAVGAWTIAWRESVAGRKHHPPVGSAPSRPETAANGPTQFWTQEARPLGHFTFLVRGIEEMIHTGRPSWPVERTLLTSGMMDLLLASRKQGGKPIDTPELNITYRPGPAWRDPGEPPVPRPLQDQ